MLAELEALWSEFAAVEEWSKQAVSLMPRWMELETILLRAVGQNQGALRSISPCADCKNEKEGRRRKGEGGEVEREGEENIQNRRRGLLERRKRASGRGEMPEGDSNGGGELDQSVL